jgi:tRNA-dihydrouridine synthase
MKTKVALAPMAGVTDSAFRLMNKLGGADLVYSEMAHVNAISYNSKQTLNMLGASPFEFPYVVQLFGKDPEYFGQAAKILSTQGVPVMKYKPFTTVQLKFIEKLADEKQLNAPGFKQFYANFLKFQKQLTDPDFSFPVSGFLNPSALDINLGCPAKKVFGHGGGAALWKDLNNVRKILESVLKNTKLPVSIKVRTAVGNVTLLDLLDTVKDLPIKRVMIHGRTYAQGFSGPIDTKLIKKVIKKYPQFEFWVNGGIVDSRSAQKIAKETGCSNLGIARGTCGNPMLADTIKNPETSNQKRVKIRHVSRFPFLVSNQCALAYVHTLLAQQSKASHGIIEMRKHLCWYFKDFPGAKEWRRKLVTVKNVKEVEKILGNFIYSQPKVSKKLSKSCRKYLY